MRKIHIDIEKELFFPWWGALLSLQNGMFLEFGCSSCATFNKICDVVLPKRVYGFDWFYGLPELWDEDNPKGSSSMNGEVPNVPRNGTIVVGLVEMSVPLFLKRHEGPVAFVHFDLDLYGPTKFCLTQIADRLADGSILAFDQIGNNAGREHEQRAFLEFLEEKDFGATIIGYRGWGQIAFRMKKNPSSLSGIKKKAVITTSAPPQLGFL